MRYKILSFLVCITVIATFAQIEKVVITECDDTFIHSPIATPPNYIQDPAGGKSELICISNYKC